MSSFTIAEIKKAINKHNKEEDKKVKVSVVNGEIKFSSGGSMMVPVSNPPASTPATATANNKIDGHKKYLKELKKKVKDLTPEEKTKYMRLAKQSSLAKKK